MTDSNDGLYESLRKRDPSALDQLIADYSGAVLCLTGMILRQVGRPQDSEEIASDVFAAAWERIGEYDPERSSFRSWLLMMTKYAALTRRRQLFRQQFSASGEAKVIRLTAALEPEALETPEDAVLRSDRRQRLHQALAQLPEQDREVLIRRYFLEEPVPDMAREAALSRSAIDNRLWRARRALQALLNKKSGVGEDEAL